MLISDYERAKSLACDRSDEALAGRIRRYDRIGTYFALVGLASIALLFGGGAMLRLFDPAFETSHAGTFRSLTILVPALGIVTFMIASDILRKRRDVVALARRLRSEAALKTGDAPCRHG